MEKQRKVPGYLYEEGDAQKPESTRKPFMAVIRDRKGHPRLKAIPPSKPTGASRSRWRSPSPAVLKNLREKAELTQAQAAAICLSALRSWQDWEGGRRRMHPAIFRVFEEACAGLEGYWQATPAKLRELRKEARITEPKAAKLCCASLVAWRGFESGRVPMPPSLYRLFFEELAGSYRITSRP